MKKLMVAVAVAGAVALGASAGTFLDSLATNANKVGSSPYATGGDIILHLTGEGLDDYVHVFTNTVPADAAGYAFTPGAAMAARVLVQAAGGAGGGRFGAGGGGGGLITTNGLHLAASTAYAVMVGGPSAFSTQKTRGGPGGNSSFGADLTAFGGGEGGTWHYSMGGGNGGCGGGSTCNDSSSGGSYTGGTGVPGQGFDGATYNGVPGGGGGSGAAALPNDKGRGGDGRMSDILGFEQHFGGGGAGGSNGGSGVGGLGGGGSVSGNTFGGDGEDGLGGGGAGGGNLMISDQTQKFGGLGGTGIVVVRYISPNAMLVSGIAISVAGGTSAKVTGRVRTFGGGFCGGSVWMEYWPTDATENVKTESMFDTDALYAETYFEGSTRGLAFGTTYAYRIMAKSAAAGAVAQQLASGEFETIGASIAGEGGVVTYPEGTFDTVHTFTEDGTFVAKGSGFARVLVVGGGGAGGRNWNGGGGGAGGLIYERAFYVEPGEYPVVIGKGGAGDKVMGTPSSVFTLTALGGGYGGNDMNDISPVGGSGGGAGNRTKGGKGTEGQGFDGGSTPNYSYGAGGGGAGGKGQDATNTYAGKGGDGVVNDISGEPVVYAAGGGGAFNPNGSQGPTAPDAPGAGGSDGVGGRGAGPSQTATDGAPNTGSGGGGGVSASGGYPSGKGADGIVIIRYTDLAAASEVVTPTLDFSLVENVTANSADLTVNVSMAGGTAEKVSLYAIYGFEPDCYIYTNLLDAAFFGERVFTLAGLSPSRDYYVRVYGDNGLEGGVAVSKEQAFHTVEALASGCAVEGAGPTRQFSGAVAGLADGSSVVKLMLGESPDALTPAETFEPMVVGDFRIEHTFGIDEFGKTIHYAFVCENSLDERSWTSSTVTNSFVLTDPTTYTWKGGAGDWRDAEMWTASRDDGRGFPVYGSTAKFVTGEEPIVVSITNAERVTVLTLSAGATPVTFKGLSDDAAISRVDSSNQAFDGDVTFDAVDFSDNQAHVNGKLTLVNGARMDVSGWNFDIGANSTVEVASGSYLKTRFVMGGNGCKLIVDNAEVDPADSYWTYNGNTDFTLILKGESPIYRRGGTYDMTSRGDCTIIFEIPAEGYKTVPFVGGISGCSRAVSVQMPKESPIHKATGKIRVQLTTGDCTASQVAFGAGDNENSEFYYDANKLWYFHTRPAGLMLILR